MPVRYNASNLGCLLYVSAIAGLSWVGSEWTQAVYSLSFWHYYLYWLAYRFGAVPMEFFKRDAILMKTVSLGLCGFTYCLAPVDLASLAVIILGFSLNALAARQLGADRTYYGYELAGLPFEKITRFPYSWISHPMLVGNIAAYGGMLINDDLRRKWWPLAVMHAAMNVALLLMELFVTPLRLRTRRPDGSRLDTSLNPQQSLDVFALSICLAAGAGWGCWAPRNSNAWLNVGLGASVSAYAYAMFYCYSRCERGASVDHLPEEIG